MSPDFVNAWLAAFRTSQNEEIPEQHRTQLKLWLVEVLLAALTQPTEPTTRARR